MPFVADSRLPELIAKIDAWGRARKIDTESDEHAQAFKTLEECGELIAACAMDYESCVREKHVRDAVGDIFVTLVMQCMFHDFDLTTAVEKAWNEIKDRRGEMRNGKFVKEEDL